MITLGINYSQMHDSAACIARDGEILFAVAEERLSRAKHDARFPHLAISACLDFARVRPADLDFVCFGWPAPRASYLHDLKSYLRGSYPLNYLNFLNSSRHFLSMWHQHGGEKRFLQNFGPTRARFRFVDHHLAHAISAYSFSGFEEAAIVIVDGRGAWEATSIWRGRDGRLKHFQTIPWPNSLGVFYARFTQFLGFQPNADEWKVMGLAPYGEPGMDLAEFIHPEDSPYRVNARLLLGPDSDPCRGIRARFGPSRISESEIEPRDKNIAYAVQEACERAMLHLASAAVRQTGCRNLCLAGGVALNSKANGKILASGLVDQIFVQPAAGDDGVCLGAALAPLLDSAGKLPVRAMRHAYLGPQFADDEIEKVLHTYKLHYSRVPDPAAIAAEMLARGKILGCFQGRMEFGPRALGNRSILADPRDPDMTAKVNNAVKFREWWRPFAPALLKSAASDYLEVVRDSPFMIVTAQVRPDKRGVIPAVTHADGSARPQTVEPETNPLFSQMLCEFGKITGVPVLMNTSFNLRGEPIVASPTDAVRTFFSSGMDALLIGSFLVEK
ncbi:MAG: carbamoyltransferase family protein [Candidatus Acidiferrales bacterium]